MELKLGVYVETLPPELLTTPDVRDLLRAFRPDVGMGFDLPYGPTTKENEAYYDRYVRAVETLAADGVRLFLWPLARKKDGYWLSERNVKLFQAGLEHFCDHAARRGVPLPGFIHDIELPWKQSMWFTEALKRPLTMPIALGRALITNRNPLRFRAASRSMTDMLDMLRPRTETSYTAVIPFCMEDLAAGGFVLQDALETPVFSVPWDHYNLMIYNSYLPVHYSFMVSRKSASRLLFEYVSELREARGDAACVTLGSTWEGIIPGNKELIFRTPDDLRPDIAAAKAAGATTMWLYCLEGVLFEDFNLAVRRSASDSAAWFEIFANTDAAEPEPDTRLTAFRLAMRAALLDPWAWLAGGGK